MSNTAAMSLAGKNVVVIGGTSGIGLATAIAASELGANVWAAGRSAAHIEKARAKVGSRVTIMSADTHDSASLQAVFKEAGVIHHLVSAATGGSRTSMRTVQTIFCEFTRFRKSATPSSALQWTTLSFLPSPAANGFAAIAT